MKNRMWKNTIILICVTFTLVQSQSRVCRIYSTATSPYYFGTFPLFENGSTLAYINEDTNIKMDDGESLSISCVGNHLAYYGVGYKNKETATMTCRNGTLFSEDWLPDTVMDLKWLTCAQPATSVEIHTRKTCGENEKGRIVEVFVESKLNQDHLLYESCFDDSIKQPLYVKYTMNITNKYSFIAKGPRSFNGDSHAFSGVNLDKIYNYGEQRDVLWAILGSNTGQYHNYDSTIINVSLTEHQNYNFDPIQRATFNYINAIPVWNRVSRESWLSSGWEVRWSIYDNDLTVYSGAWGVNTLKDENGEQQEIWLEGKGSKRYPSPLWLYRVVYEAATKNGIVFLVLNNPHVTLTEAKQLAEVFACGDVCPNMSWITTATPAKGYVICCEIDDFRKVVKDLPSFETEGLLPYMFNFK